jgi:hypothetical protein
VGAARGDPEIPLLLVLFYLLHEAETGESPASQATPAPPAICVEDKVRWGVWLGRHIC